MLDIKYIQDNPELVQKSATNKNVQVNVKTVLSSYEKRNRAQQEVEVERNKLNELTKKIQKATNTEREKYLNLASKIKKDKEKAEKIFVELDSKFQELILKLPNIPTEDTPIGKDDTENVVIKKVGSETKFDFTPKHHEELGITLDLLDKEKAAKISGARFAYIKRELALLEFAIIQFVFEFVTNEKKLAKIFKKAGINISPKAFIPILPPVFIRSEVFNAMGRLEPREDKYEFPEDNQFLVGSAEHTLGPLHMQEVLPEEQLPLRYIGFSTCFRREAGTYGKDMRGIVRMHQFDKIEMETFTTPQNGRNEQLALVAIQEHIMNELKLPYQVVSICTGDMGKPDAKQIDIECYMPGQNKYVETHSADYMGDFQARRLKTFTKVDLDKVLIHMNDATAVAFSRILAAIMENYQTKEGDIMVPKVLQPHMHGIKKISRT